MASHGGYREPSNPAAVSGPGALAKRTDGAQPNMDLGSQSYGDGQDIQSVESGAAMPQSTGPSPQQQQLIQQLASQVQPMGAPSAQPGVPVTSGAASGPGAGIGALNLPQQNPSKQEAQALAASLPVFIRLADSDGATPAFKQYVRNLIIAANQP